MSSYASVAAHNAPPPDQQPQPDPALLNTESPSHSNLADDAAKVNIVAPDFKQDPRTYTSESNITVDQYESDNATGSPATPRKANKRKQHVEEEAHDLWYKAKNYLIRPGVAGGLIGLVNIGLLASVGRAFYVQPHLRRDFRAISTLAGAAVALLSVEGFAAEKYRQTPQGKKEEERARKEGALLFQHLHEQIIRPRVLGGILGFVNAAILSTVGYFSYANWNKRWDKRIVSAVSVGLLTLWNGEGFIAERYTK